MPTYEVILKEMIEYEITVKAEDAKQAGEKAEKALKTYNGAYLVENPNTCDLESVHVNVDDLKTEFVFILDEDEKKDEPLAGAWLPGGGEVK